LLIKFILREQKTAFSKNDSSTLGAKPILAKPLLVAQANEFAPRAIRPSRILSFIIAGIPLFFEWLCSPKEPKYQSSGGSSSPPEGSGLDGSGGGCGCGCH